ncbi:MAG: HD domain-containing protein [Candidatus Cloacimonetes bacterium]|nr:HD domain-containing protein [Candidatus Cloacimonadota bacterium]
MERITIRELPQYLGRDIVSYFLVQEKELKQGVKDFYIRMRLGDEGGSVNGYIWTNAQQSNELFEEGDIIKIKGMVKDYKGQLQIAINNLRVAEENEYELKDFIPTTSKDINQLADNLFAYINGIGNEFLKKLLLSIFEDQEFLADFIKSPAAKNWHHNYAGGLLEHTIAVAIICDFVAHHYPVDKDILITGALLHDIGKVHEYNMKAAIDFTNIGRLVGHISIADEIVTKKAANIDAFPDELLMKIRHLILSHHGEYEKGAVRLPQTIEAVVLHYADNLDAQTTGVMQLINAVQDENAEWTEYDKLNNRYIYINKEDE